MADPSPSTAAPTNGKHETVSVGHFPNAPSYATDDEGAFSVYVCKEDFKFNAGHFVAYEGFRERLHGHNYRVGVRLLGHRKLNPDGYVIDFGVVKGVTRKICKKLNERFLCPMYSNVLTITEDEEQQQISITCEDGSFFSMPSGDVAKLPIVHSTVEEIAIYVWSEILSLLDSSYLTRRGIHTMEVTCAEAAGQESQFRWRIPNQHDPKFSLDVRSFVAPGKVELHPCHNPVHAMDKSNRTSGSKGDGSKELVSEQLDRLAQVISERCLGEGKITREDLEAMLN